MTTVTTLDEKVAEAKEWREKTIPVAEIFGPTIQGEGLLAGRPTYFVRVGGCDFKCLWCDTAHAVLVENVRGLRRLTEDEIINELFDLVLDHRGPDWLAISGGNPGLYDLKTLVGAWQATGAWQYQRRVTVETQGSKWQPWFAEVNVLTVSPKPPSSGMTNDTLDYFIQEGMASGEELHLRWHNEDQGMPEDYYHQVLKCIVFDEIDYQFARDLHRQYPLIPFYLSCGTAMGGLSGKWVAPAIPGLWNGSGEQEYDRFKTLRANPDLFWTPGSYVDTKDNLLRRYRWLVERMMNDEAMSDVAVFPQIHVLLWGVNTKGV